MCYLIVSNENNEEILWFIHRFGIRNTSLRAVKISSPKVIKLRSRNTCKKSHKKYTSETKTGKNQINNIK